MRQCSSCVDLVKHLIFVIVVDAAIIEQAKTYEIARAFREVVDVLEVEYQSFGAVLEAEF